MNKFFVDYMNIITSVLDLEEVYETYKTLPNIKYVALVGNKNVLDSIADDLMINKFKDVVVFPIYYMTPDNMGETINTSMSIRGVYLDIDEVMNHFSYSDAISRIVYQVKIIHGAGMPTYLGLRLDNKELVDDLSDSLPSNAHIVWYFKDNFITNICVWMQKYINNIEKKGGTMPFVIVNASNTPLIDEKFKELIPFICPATISSNYSININIKETMGTALLGLLMEKVIF